MYIWRNIINVGLKGPFSGESNQASKLIKSGSGGVGAVYIYHNTILQPAAPYHGLTGAVINDASGGTAKNMVTRNNIFHVRSSSDICIKDTNSANNDYDYDLYIGVIPSSEELHGINNTPVYEPRNPDGVYALATTSPGYNAGIVLANFNDGYEGTAPDMGAYERGMDKLEYGVNAYKCRLGYRNWWLPLVALTYPLYDE